MMKLKALAMSLVLLAGCTDGGSFTPSTGVTTSPSSPPLSGSPPLLGEGVVVSQNVSPEEGGTIALPDESLTVEVPAAALTEPVEITVEQVSGDDLETIVPGVTFDTAFDFGPDGTQFEEPIALAVALDPIPVTDVTETLTQAPLVVLTSADGTSELLEPTVNVNLDDGSQTLETLVPHFSTVAIAALDFRGLTLGQVSLDFLPDDLDQNVPFTILGTFSPGLANVTFPFGVSLGGNGFDRVASALATKTDDGRIGFSYKVFCTTPGPQTLRLIVEATTVKRDDIELDSVLELFPNDQSRLVTTVFEKSIDCIAATDSDQDGLTNENELLINSDPLKVDSDDDGVNDPDEDADADGLTNLTEQTIGTNPANADSDGNNVCDCNEDTDGDGLTNLQEISLGTDPTKSDTDNNGVDDGLEDTDGDGLSNAIELALGLNPALADSDGNGVTDDKEDSDLDRLQNGFELIAGTPLDGSQTPGTCDCSLDPDNDGLTHLIEQSLGTNPLSADSDDDGIVDSDEDTDGDGLSNAAEVNQVGTDPVLDDTDSNGTKDGDEDNDNDGLTNAFEVANGLDPNSDDTDGDGIKDGEEQGNSNTPDLSGDEQTPETPEPDADGDGTVDSIDTDDDNDGVLDTSDAFPTDPSESVDTDLDGIGNNADTDDDGDMVADSDDAFPLDPTESVDTDMDGVGNNFDLDDDGDGVIDSEDFCPLDPDCQVNPALQRSATIIAQAGDVPGGTTLALTNVRPEALADNQMAIISGLLENDQPVLMAYNPELGDLDIIATQAVANSNGFNFGTAFQNFKVASSDGAIYFENFEDLAEVTGQGLVRWHPDDGIEMVRALGDACIDSGVVTDITLQVNANDFIVLTQRCDDGTLETFYGRHDQLQRLLIDDLPISGFSSDPENPATLDVSSGIIGSDGFLAARGSITCVSSLECRNSRASQLLSISPDGDRDILLNNLEQIVDESPRAMRIVGDNLTVDGLGRIYASFGTFASSASVLDIGPSMLVMIEGNRREAIIIQEFSDIVAPGLPDRTIGNVTPTLFPSESGALLIQLNTKGTDGVSRDTLYTYRDGELDPLIVESDNAPGYENPLDVIFNTQISPAGRAIFSARVAEEPDFFYIEDSCTDEKLFPVNRSLLPSSFPTFTNLTPTSSNGNHQVLADAQFDAENFVVLFNLPEDTCDTSVKINAIGDEGDNNPGDGECDTGSVVAGVPSCTLRAAIEENNATSDGLTATFDFPAATEDIVIQPSSPLPSISKRLQLIPSDGTNHRLVLEGNLAGDTSGLTVLQSGGLTLRDVTIKQFMQSGIDANLTGNTIILENVDLQSNGNYGLLAGGLIKVSGTESRDAKISDNGDAGILSEGKAEIQFADISDNLGAGLIAQDRVLMTSSHVDRNGAVGFVNTQTNNCNDGVLTVQLPQSSSASITTSFNENEGRGISIEGGRVSLSPGTEVNDNLSGGIFQACGKLVTGDVGRPDETQIQVKNNAFGTSCFDVDGDNEYQVVSTSCSGGGIELHETSISTTLDDMEIHSNGGFGVLSTGPLVLSNVNITNNQGPGAWIAKPEGDTRTESTVVMTASGVNLNITGNLSDGIIVESGKLSASQNPTISSNLGSGIIVKDGNAELGDPAAQQLVDGNGTGSQCHNWSFDSDTETATKSLGSCGTNGIDIQSGDLTTDNLTVKNHSGTGIKVVGDANLTRTTSCNNGTNVDVSGTLTTLVFSETCP